MWWPTAALAIFLAAGPAGSTPVPWNQIRDTIGQTICVELHSSQAGDERFSFVHGSRETCTKGGATTPVERAVDRAIEEIARWLRSKLGLAVLAAA